MPTVSRRDRMVQKGSISVALLATSKVVVFTTPFVAAYDLYFKTTTGITVTAIPATDANGFTLSLGITLAGSIDWVAVEQLS